MRQIEFALTPSSICEDIITTVNGKWFKMVSDDNCFQPKIEKVIFNDPATIVYWGDNTKTVVKCQEGDTYSKEVGLALCIAKKYLGNKSNFNNEFKKWIPEEEKELNGKNDCVL